MRKYRGIRFMIRRVDSLTAEGFYFINGKRYIERGPRKILKAIIFSAIDRYREVQNAKNS